MDECVWWMETVSSDDGETWEDTGYELSEGDCEDGDFWEGGTGPDIGAGSGGGTSGPGGTGGTPENDCPGWYKLMPNYEGGGFDPATPYPCDNPPAPYLDDPCMQSQVAANTATTLSQNQHFISAKSDVIQYGANGNEHVVSFGKYAFGNIIRTPVNPGGISSGTVPTIGNRFADLHNHPNSLPPSAGDIYYFIDNAAIASGYQRFITTMDGTVYALTVINQTTANAFKANNPMVQIQGYPPDFPSPIFDEFAETKSYLINIMSIEPMIADEMALALVLEKHNSGIALLKQDNDGNFKRLRTTENSHPDGSKTYTANNCP